MRDMTNKELDAAMQQEARVHHVLRPAELERARALRQHDDERERARASADFYAAFFWRLILALWPAWLGAALMWFAIHIDLFRDF